MEEDYALFETARGTCALGWSGAGVTFVQLPERTRAATEARVLASRPGAREAAPAGAAAEAVALLTRHLAGDVQDLSAVAIDGRGLTPFRRAVADALRRVRPGSTVSYGELARLAGAPGAARAVGRAMATNPVPLLVPCHRVLAAGQRIGGFSAHGGAQTKVDLLALEGVTLPGSALGLGFEPAEAVETLARADAALGALIEAAGPLRLLVDPLASPFAALAKSIAYQQLTGRAAATILGRVKERFGGRLPAPAELRAAPDEELRATGLSRPKVAALKDLAQKALDGVVPSLRELRTMGDEAIVERLVQVRGIGRWSVEMLLIFGLGRPDVFPADDYGVRKGLTALTGAPELLSAREAAAMGEAWRPYRTVASWYLWRAAERPELVKPARSRRTRSARAAGRPAERRRPTRRPARPSRER
jgi:methylated-DNA-[protein]-cysteine S-methyltransferase